MASAALLAVGPAWALSLAFGGDVMLGSEYPEGFMPPEDGRNLLAEIAPVLRESELVFVNLEGVVSDRKLPPRDCGQSNRCFRFRMPGRYAGLLKDAGVSVVSLANNHAYDFGPEGVADTLQAVKAAGLVGVGSLAQPSQVVVARDGSRVGYLAVAPHDGVAPMLDAAYVRDAVQALRKEADWVVVSMHAGGEGAAATRVTGQTEMYLGANRGNVSAFARQVIEHGADMVIGHGPHVLRGMECYRGKLIAYSLGNFVTFGLFNLNTPLNWGGVLQVDVTPKGAVPGKAVLGRFVGFEQSHRSTGLGPQRSTLPEKFLYVVSRENFKERSAVAADGRIACPPAGL